MELRSAPSRISVCRWEQPELAVKVVKIRVCVLSRQYRVVAWNGLLDRPLFFFLISYKSNLLILGKIKCASIFYCLSIHLNLCFSIKGKCYWRLSKISLIPDVWNNCLALGIYFGKYCCMIVGSSVLQCFLSSWSSSCGYRFYHRKGCHKVLGDFLYFFLCQCFILDLEVVDPSLEVFSAVRPVCLSDLKNAVISKDAWQSIIAFYRLHLHSIDIENCLISCQHHIYVIPVTSCYRFWTQWAASLILISLYLCRTI